jgi:CDP-glucose 4,6-dehydratase
MVMNLDFFKGKNVFVTGHTGFKGIWLSKMLEMGGANVTGYSLHPITKDGENIFHRSGIEKKMNSVVGDVREYTDMKKVFDDCQPEIVLHLAAQPIVIESYRDPVGTYSTNVMGTVNILECVRNSKCVKSFLNVTTDKVYKNNEWVWGYRENEPLDGFDPYSNSKSCSELVTHSYKNSFFSEVKVAVSTARAGNVIGGGDFSINRIIPDSIRKAYERKKIEVRNPYSIRPYQHVLEPLYAYLMICQAQYEDMKYAGYYNVGPDECDCVTTGELVELFCRLWGDGQSWEDSSVNGPHEAQLLKLDCSKLKNIFKWKPKWHIEDALQKTIDWAKIYQKDGDIDACMQEQIKNFLKSN